MKKLPILIAFIAVILTVSCSKKASEITKSIPDEAFLVASFHPKQLFDKGQLSSMNSLLDKIDNEFLISILKDPAKSGIDLNEYAYLFAYFIDDDPIIGVTSVISDDGNFNSMIKKLIENEDLEIKSIENYSLLAPENDDAAMAWNNDQVIFLTAPDKDMTAEEWQKQLLLLFDLTKEEAVTSIVDFNDFTGKMEDMNIWFTGDKLTKILEKTGALKNMEFKLPMQFQNNYGQIFIEFAEGAMYMHSENHMSDDVTKVSESFMVAKDEMNENLLKLAPGNDLLMAMAYSVDIDKLVKMMKNYTPPEINGVSDKIKETTGIEGNEILEALNGDFVIAINGAPEGAKIPVEITIGIGLDDETLQEKLMGTVGNMTNVEKEGDFFLINANGIELYSGIVDGIWVITNAGGYKDDISGKGLKKTLNDSKFKDYSSGSMGMYMNLDISTYPVTLQGMLSSGGAPEILGLVSESFLSLGMEASNQESNLTLKTAKADENSLYTLLKLVDMAEK